MTFYTVQLSQDLNLNILKEVAISAGYSLYSLLFGVCIWGLYLTTVIPVGVFATKYILGESFQKASFWEKYLYSLISGFSIFGIVLFFLAGYSLLNIPILIGLVSLMILIFLIYLKPLGLLLKIKSFILKPITLTLTPQEIGLYIIALIFISIILVFSLQKLPSGPDGYRIYLNIVKELARNERLPITSGLLTVPFIAELAIAPAFKLGGSIAATFILKIISLHVILAIFFLAKNINRKNLELWTLLPVILFPLFLRILVGEFKIDIIATMVNLVVVNLFVLYYRNKDQKYLYLGSLFLGYSILIKLTSIFLIPPFILAVLLTQFSTKVPLIKTIKTILYMSLLITIMPFIWFTFYKSTFPFIGTLGLGLFPVSNISMPETNLSQCLSSILELEQQDLYNMKKGPIKYLFAVVTYFMPARASLSFILSDLGVWFSSLMTLFAIVVVKKWSNFKKDNLSIIILLIAFGSFVPVFIITPVLPWYAATSFILLYIVGTIYLSKTKQTTLVKPFVIFVSLASMYSFIFIDGLTNFVAPLGSQPVSAKYLIYNQYKFSEEMAQELNKYPMQNVLFSSFSTFSNINYHIDNYFERIVYFDQYSSSYSKEDFLKLNEKYNFKYLVLNKLAITSGIQCLADINNNIQKDIYEIYGTKVYENESYAVYQNNLFKENIH